MNDIICIGFSDSQKMNLAKKLIFVRELRKQICSLQGEFKNKEDITMAWYDSAVFYHIYPIGLGGCAHENHEPEVSKFPKITEWTMHAKEIGCTAIYIGPLFQSVGHGYETIDYKLVDQRIGTNEEFTKYVDKCHAEGLKVIVDGVFNHVGREFFAFKDLKEKREASPYKDWFCNVNFGGNNEYNDGFCYDNWGGYNLLVKLNLRNPVVKEYLFDAVRFWINEFHIDGIRLDAADVLDRDYMRELRAVTDAAKPEFWLMGEVIHGNYSEWANGNMLHSVTNYELHKAIFSGHNDHNYFEIAHCIQRMIQLCGQTKLYTFTDNHDVARIYSKLTNKAHMNPVAFLQYGLPGVPSIYYGSEFGIEGDKQRESDWNLRPSLSLDDFKGNEYVELFKLLGRAKKEFPELSHGRYEQLLLQNRSFAFGRILDKSAVIVLVNNDDNPADMYVRLPIGASKAYDILKNFAEDTVEETTVEAEPEKRDPKPLQQFAEKAKAFEGQIAGVLAELDEDAFSQKAEALGGILKTLEAEYQDMMKSYRVITQEASHNFAEGSDVELVNGQVHVVVPANSGCMVYVGN